MNRIFRKVHIYVGLLCFVILLIDGITGIAVTLAARPEERGEPPASTAKFDYVPPGNLSDRDAAHHVWQFLKLPLTSPPQYGIQRDERNNLKFGFYTPRGVLVATVLEKEKKVQVETRPFRFWMFLNTLHSSTLRDEPFDWRMRAWSLCNEFAIFGLLFLTASGLYLWLSTRPRHRLAQLTLALGGGSFVVLYLLSR